MKMKNFLLLALISSLTALACTKKDGTPEAIAAAKNQYQAQVVADAEGFLDPKHPLFSSYVNYMLTSAEFSVAEVLEVSPESRVFQIKVVGVPQKNRKVLAEIGMKRKEEYQAKSFNFGSALNLVEQQEGMVKGPEETALFIRLQKGPQGWKADSKPVK